MVEILTEHDILRVICKAKCKWGMFVYFSTNDSFDEVVKAAPYLNKNAQILSDGRAYVITDTKEELDNFYYQTVGDDGPTKLNSYNGSAKVYALTCNPEGNFLNENT